MSHILHSDLSEIPTDKLQAEANYLFSHMDAVFSDIRNEVIYLRQNIPIGQQTIPIWKRQEDLSLCIDRLTHVLYEINARI